MKGTKIVHLEPFNLVLVFGIVSKDMLLLGSIL